MRERSIHAFALMMHLRGPFSLNILSLSTTSLFLRTARTLSMSRRIGPISWRLIACLIPLGIVPSALLIPTGRIRLLLGLGSTNLVHIGGIDAGLPRSLTDGTKLCGMFPQLHAPLASPWCRVAALHGLLDALQKLVVLGVMAFQGS